MCSLNSPVEGRGQQQQPGHCLLLLVSCRQLFTGPSSSDDHRCQRSWSPIIRRELEDRCGIGRADPDLNIGTLWWWPSVVHWIVKCYHVYTCQLPFGIFDKLFIWNLRRVSRKSFLTLNTWPLIEQVHSSIVQISWIHLKTLFLFCDELEQKVAWHHEDDTLTDAVFTNDIMVVSANSEDECVAGLTVTIIRASYKSPDNDHHITTTTTTHQFT